MGIERTKDQDLGEQQLWQGLRIAVLRIDIKAASLSSNRCLNLLRKVTEGSKNVDHLVLENSIKLTYKQ